MSEQDQECVYLIQMMVRKVREVTENWEHYDDKIVWSLQMSTCEQSAKKAAMCSAIENLFTDEDQLHFLEIDLTEISRDFLMNTVHDAALTIDAKVSDDPDDISVFLTYVNVRCVREDTDERERILVEDINQYTFLMPANSAETAIAMATHGILSGLEEGLYNTVQIHSKGAASLSYEEMSTLISEARPQTEIDE